MRRVNIVSASTRRVDVDGVVERPDWSPDGGVMALGRSGSGLGGSQRLRHGTVGGVPKKSVS